MANPVLKIKKNNKEKQFEVITLLTVMLYWVAARYRYTKIPDTIPIHYDIDGSIDKYGSKIFIFTFPFLATVIYLSLLIVTKNPHKFTYNVKITHENAERQYRNALQMMRTMNLSLIISFLFIDAPVLFTEDGILKELNGFSFIIMGILPIFTITYYMSRSL